MANQIESQTRTELGNLENIVTAVESLGNIAASLQPGDMPDYAYLVGYLTSDLQRQFQGFHITLSKRVLPLVADITSMRVA